MAGVLSDQIKFSYKASAESTYAQVKGLQAIPSLGGSRNKIDITCLEDVAHKYMNGLKDYGDSLDFTFLYDNTKTTGNYAVLSGLDEDTAYDFKVEMKGGETFTFSAEPSVAIDDVAVDSAITFTLSCALQSDITYTPAA